MRWPRSEAVGVDGISIRGYLDDAETIAFGTVIIRYAGGLRGTHTKSMAYIAGQKQAMVLGDGVAILGAEHTLLQDRLQAMGFATYFKRTRP